MLKCWTEMCPSWVTKPETTEKPKGCILPGTRRIANSMRELMEAKPGDGVITDTIGDFAESKLSYWEYWEKRRREFLGKRGKL